MGYGPSPLRCAVSYCCVQNLDPEWVQRGFHCNYSCFFIKGTCKATFTADHCSCQPPPRHSSIEHLLSFGHAASNMSIPHILSRVSTRSVVFLRSTPGGIAFRALSTASNKPGGGAAAASKKPDMALLRELREASGAPIVDCKNALAVRDRSIKRHIYSEAGRYRDRCAEISNGDKFMRMGKEM